MKKTKIDPTEPNSPATALHSSSAEETRKESGQEKGKAAPENGESKTIRSKKFFLLLGFAGLVVVVGGLGTAAFLGWIGTPPWFSSEKPSSPSPVQPVIGPMIKLTPLIINLHEDAGDHYIKTTLILEIGQKDWLEEVQTRVPSIIDMLILTLGDKKMEELRRPELREELKKDLLRKANQQFSSGKIKQIYFDEFLYQ
jgi:flagellar basal body-associated protein FliL